MYESNQDVMAALYEAYEQPMYGIAYAILHDRYQAEDAVQEAFIRMVRYLPKCRDIYSQKTKTLIVRCIKSAAIDIYRINKRESGHISTEENTWIEDNHNAIESYMETISFCQMLDKIRDRLPGIYQDVIRMRFYYGMPVAAISKELGISEDNVYQRLSRARKLVKEIIGEDLAHEERIG